MIIIFLLYGIRFLAAKGEYRLEESKFLLYDNVRQKAG